jgi:hypothetical protein
MKSVQFSRVYHSGALMLMNTLLLFLVLNILAAIFLSVHRFLSSDNPVAEKYGEEQLHSVYPGLSNDEIHDLLHETWSRPYVYEPFTQFRERVYHGEYVNVDTSGFRSIKDQAVWPPPQGEINVFVFGGSTTFGYGVTDGQTIASRLQERLRRSLGKSVNVYNFGRGFYFSTQERILFELLLASGHTPALAIFIDGLNDFYHYDGNPVFTERLVRYMNGELPENNVITKMPITKLIKTLLGDYQEKNLEFSGAGGDIHHDVPSVLNGVIARYVGNKKAIEALSAAYGVKTLFVWQPVPTYNYDDSYHPFKSRGYGRHMFSHFGYSSMKKYVGDNPMGKDFLWAADIQQHVKRPLYVDLVHYSGEFSGMIADFIARYLVKNYF